MLRRGPLSSSHASRASHCGGFSVVVGHAVGSPRTGFISCTTQTQLPRSSWDLLRPGIEPVSPVLVGGCLSREGPLVSLDAVPLDLGVLVLGSQMLRAPNSMKVRRRACHCRGAVSTPREEEVPAIHWELGCSTWSLNERARPCTGGSRGWGRLIQAHLD